MHMVVATYADAVLCGFWINFTLLTGFLFLSFSQLNNDCGLFTLKEIQFVILIFSYLHSYTTDF
jgi:hypothetical protein